MLKNSIPLLHLSFFWFWTHLNNSPSKRTVIPLKMEEKIVKARRFPCQTTNLASARYFGTFDMLSMPPATTTSLMPNWMLCAASIVANGKTQNTDVIMKQPHPIKRNVSLEHYMHLNVMSQTFHSRCTNFVYSGANNCIRNACTQSCLPGRSLPQVGTEYISKENFFNK